MNQQPDEIMLHDDTDSGDATYRVRGFGRRIQARVCAVLAACGPMTADEVAETIGESILNVRPRVSELVKLGALRDSGIRGRNMSGHKAAKWVVA
ncbi:MAG TPA: hypothetical protein VMT54_04725 [Candidatus Cybelea sp.]|nr:hypothetical protein [Candidatus Cybelea sp.]